jgi:RTX calcium-binding nonapeptide repeat (4 copies)
VIRQGHLIAVVGAFLIGCAVLLLVSGCVGVRSEAAQKEEQARSDRCEETRTFKVYAYETGPKVYTTNDVPGCPKGGLLPGTDGRDKLNGQDGDDELHGLGKKDTLMGAMGSDVIYGGDGNDDVLWGDLSRKGAGEDVIYGGDGNDTINSDDGNRDKINCGKGRDEYFADRHDYVDSSCEEEGEPLPPAAGGAKDVIDCTNRTGKNAPRVCKSLFREQNAQ